MNRYEEAYAIAGEIAFLGMLFADPYTVKTPEKWAVRLDELQLSLELIERDIWEKPSLKQIVICGRGATTFLSACDVIGQELYLALNRFIVDYRSGKLPRYSFNDYLPGIEIVKHSLSSELAEVLSRFPVESESRKLRALRLKNSGLTWPQVAEIIEGDRSLSDSLRKEIDRFVKENPHLRLNVGARGRPRKTQE